MTEPSDSVRRRSLSGALLNRNRTTRQSTATVITNQESRSEFNRRRATISADTAHNKVHVRIVPSIENVNRSLIFDIVDRDLEVGSILRIGRYSDRHASDNCMSFKSKVVSRCHCEVWAETDGKLYIRDTKSSSGTFLNHVRLSPANTESRAVEINDGDIIQLGVDFQGGREEIYRSVKMKFEVNRSKKASRLSFNINQFQNLRALIQPPLPTTTSNNNNNNNNMNNNTATASTTTTTNITNDDQEITSPSSSSAAAKTDLSASSATKKPAHATTTVATDDLNNNHFDECCICLYAMAPFQALFVSPCSHSYHYKCIRPLLSSYPGFQCPICRHYSDLEASVATEEEEEEEVSAAIATETVKHILTNATEATAIVATSSENEGEQQQEQQPTIDSGLALSSPTHEIVDEMEEEEEEPTSSMVIHDEPSSENISSSSSSGTDEDSEELPDVEEEEDEDPAPLPMHGDNPYSTTFVSSPIIYSEPLPEPALSELATQSRTAERVTPRGRERKSSHLMDKIKMVFFEKRKSISLSTTSIKPRSNNSNSNTSNTSSNNSNNSSNNNNNTSSNSNNNNNNRRRRQRPLSYPNLLQSTLTEPQSETGNGGRRSLFPLSHTLSRQSNMDSFSFRRRQNTMVES